MRSSLIRFGLAAAVAAGAAAPAPAFYWIGWPGANTITPPSIVPTTERVDERPPSGVVTPPPGNPPPDTPPPDNPKGVPEPTTIGIAAIGLGGLAFGWWKKRKKK